MPFDRHVRLTMSGTIGDGSEIFSMGLSLAQQSQDWLSDALIPDFPSNDIADDWRGACVAFWTGAVAPVTATAHLKRITIAQIGTNGRYEHAPKEYAVNYNGGYGGTAKWPWQVSLAATLETDADLGRVKGRFYLPCPDGVLDPNTDLIDVATAEGLRNATVTLINDLADQPGVDLADWRVVVASTGRRNANGTQRLAPGNFDVQRVNVGRRLDIQRRRANKVSETRTADAAVNQV